MQQEIYSTSRRSGRKIRKLERKYRKKRGKPIGVHRDCLGTPWGEGKKKKRLQRGGEKREIKGL